MEKNHSLPFEVGQLAEAKSFQQGFRGAWFRCKIKQIKWREQHLSYLMDYYDFPDDKDSWVRVYQTRATGMKYLMVRPQYPSLYHSSQIPVVGSVSEVVVVADGNWKVGDLVDWKKDDCYWSGKVTRIFDNRKAEIEMPSPPMGEGSSYEVPFEDLRPSLEWSPENGWVVPTCTDAGISSQCARLIQPVNQDSGEHSVRQMSTLGKSAADNQVASGLASAPSDLAMRPPRGSHESTTEKTEVKKEPLGCVLGKRAVDNQAASGLPSAAPCNLAMRPPRASHKSTTEKTEAKKELLDNKNTIVPEMNSVADSNPLSQGGAGIADFAAQADEKHLAGSDFAPNTFRGRIPLNSWGSHTLESGIIDLEELVNIVIYLKRIARAAGSPSNSARSMYEFIEHLAASMPR